MCGIDSCDGRANLRSRFEAVFVAEREQCVCRGRRARQAVAPTGLSRTQANLEET
jgi:hypothetical protein